MQLNNATEYFRENQQEVVSWWNPESGIGAETFRHGLDRVIQELKSHSIKNVLDAACGKGRASKELAKFFDVTAVDISATMLSIVADLKIPNVKTVKANVENLPFKEESFDAIVLLATAVHLDNPEKVFKEFYRVLRPNGLLILDIDNKFGAIRLLKNFLDPIFCFFDESYKAEWLKRRQIFQPLSSSKTAHLLNSAGFKMRRKFYIGLIMPFKLKNRLILSPRFFSYFKPLTFLTEKFPLIRNLSTYSYFICQK